MQLITLVQLQLKLSTSQHDHTCSRQMSSDLIGASWIENICVIIRIIIWWRCWVFLGTHHGCIGKGCHMYLWAAKSRELVNVMSVTPDWNGTVVFMVLPVCHGYECTCWTCWLTALASMVVMFSVWWTTCSSIFNHLVYTTLSDLQYDHWREKLGKKGCILVRSLLLQRQTLLLFHFTLQS